MSVRVRLTKPAASAAQSATGNSRLWEMMVEPTDPPFNDPLMGWSGSKDVNRQVRLTFETRDQAMAYARKRGFEVVERAPKTRAFRQKAYADNFAFRNVS